MSGASRRPVDAGAASGNLPAEPGSLHACAVALLRARGATPEGARHVADGLCWASLRGVDSHGVRLLPHYLRALGAGRVNGRPRFRWHGASTAAGTLLADRAFGHAAGAVAVDEAVVRARESGVGAVAVADSSHFGAAGWFAVRAARAGMLGFAFTHADSLLLSHDGRRPFFGTNPVAFAAPMAGSEPLCLDMATSLVSWNRVLERRGRGEPLEPGWAVDAAGHPTCDAERAAALCAAGGYKGVGLAFAIEILCALLTGMPAARDLCRMYADPIERPRHLGHFFLALDPAAFPGGPELPARVLGLAHALREEPAQPGRRVRAPGDPQEETRRERERHGVPLPAELWRSLRELAAGSGVAPPRVAEAAPRPRRATGPPPAAAGGRPGA